MEENNQKCLKKLIRECEWKEFCDDIDGARKPMIVDKSLIESGSCPRTGTNMEDVEIEEVERSREDKCEDCPYCNSRGVSFLIEVCICNSLYFRNIFTPHHNPKFGDMFWEAAEPVSKLGVQNMHFLNLNLKKWTCKCTPLRTRLRHPCSLF